MTRSPDAEDPIGARRPISIPWDEAGPDDELRDTGIALLGRIPWGSHVCLFCETEQDLVDAAISFLKPAHEGSEYAVWVVSEPLDVKRAVSILRRTAPDLERQWQAGSLEIVSAADWYGPEGPSKWSRVVRKWRDKAAYALEKGFKGFRTCGEPLLRGRSLRPDVVEYEHALEASLADQRIVMLCLYRMEQSKPRDLLDVAQNHQCVIARRHGQWQFLETPGVAEAKQEIQVLNRDLDHLRKEYRGGGDLTDRERVVLAQIVKGASSKEAARILGISPRTVDFHRANIMQKLAAKNTADLVRKVLADR